MIGRIAIDDTCVRHLWVVGISPCSVTVLHKALKHNKHLLDIPVLVVILVPIQHIRHQLFSHLLTMPLALQVVQQPLYQVVNRVLRIGITFCLEMPEDQIDQIPRYTLIKLIVAKVVHKQPNLVMEACL